MAINHRTFKNGWRFVKSIVGDREPSLPLHGASSSSDMGLQLFRFVEKEAHCLILGLISPVLVVFFLYWNKLLMEADCAVQMELAVAALVSFYCNRDRLQNRWLTDLHSIQEVSQQSSSLKNMLVARLEKKKIWLYSIISGCFIFTGVLRIYWFVTVPNGAIGKIGWSLCAVLCFIDALSVTYRVGVVLCSSLIFQSRCIVQLLKMEEFSGEFLERSKVHRNLFDDLKKIETRLDLIGIDHQFYVAAFVITTAVCELCNCLLVVKWDFDFKTLELIVTAFYLAVNVLMFTVHAVKISDQAKVLTHEVDQWITTLGVQDLHKGDQSKKMNLMKSVFYEMYLSKSRNDLATYLKKYIRGVYIYGHLLDKNLLRGLVMTQVSLGAWILKRKIGF